MQSPSDRETLPWSSPPAKQKWINRYQQQTSLTVYALEELEAGLRSWEDFVVLNLDRWEQHSYNVLIDLRQDVPGLPRLAKLR